MTSLINTIAVIDTTYPVAGQDNDSQGFRNNFGAIDQKFVQATTEVTDLQTRALVNSDANNDPAVNDLFGSSITNGLYNKFYTTAHEFNAATSADIDLHNGVFQVVTLTGNATLTFNNWPTTGQYAKTTIHFKSDSVSARTPTLASHLGTVVFASDFPGTFIMDIDGTKVKVIEAWSYDAGVTVFVRYLGEFNTP